MNKMKGPFPDGNSLKLLDRLLVRKNDDISAYKRHIRRQLAELSAARNRLESLQGTVAELDETISARQQTLSRLKEEESGYRDLLLRKEQSFNFWKEYNARSNYYKNYLSAHKRNSTEHLRNLQDILSSNRHIIISCETLQAINERPKQLLDAMSSHAYLCIECVPSYGTPFRVEKVKDHYYTMNDERFLLPLLQNRSVIALCSWVLQLAWYDFLPDKILWYDLCATEEVLFSRDIAAQLIHWEMLTKAKFITCNGSGSPLAYYRKDAVHWPADVEAVPDTLLEQLNASCISGGD